MQMKKIKIILSTILALVMIPLAVRAQGPTGDSAAEPPTNLKIIGNEGQQPSSETAPKALPADPTARKVNLIITVTSSGNNRFLGGVSIKIDGISMGETPDPPPPRGYIIPEVPSGKHEIIAERALGNGYKMYDENITIPDSKSNYDLSIKLAPAAGTYAVKDSDIRRSNQASQYTATPQQLYRGMYPGQAAYNQGNPQYLAGTNGSSAINPLTNYLGTNYPAYFDPRNQYGISNTPSYLGNQQGYSGLYNQQQGLGYNLPNNIQYGNPAYQYQSPSTYYLTSNQANTVPFKLTIDTSKVPAISDVGTAEIKIYDAQNAGLYNLQSAVPYLTSSDYGTLFNRYGCLSPNRSYILSISITQSDGTQLQPIQKGFISPNTGDVVEIYVDWGAFLSGNTNAVASRNLQLSGNTDPNFAAFRCPYSYYQSQNLNGPGVFSDPILDLQNMGNYQVSRDYRNGNYYLANTDNYWDSRGMTFVDRGDGLGGLAFFTASSNGYFGLSFGSGGDLNFYVGLYNRDKTNGSLSFNNNRFYQTKVSPTAYSNYTHAGIAQSFPQYYPPQTSISAASETPTEIIPQTTTGGNTLPTTSTDSGVIQGTTTEGGTIPQTTTGDSDTP